LGAIRPSIEVMKVGRGNKLKLTQQQQRAVLGCVRDGDSMDKICTTLNISRSTLFYYSKRDPIFGKKLEQARVEAAHSHADKLLTVYDNTETMTDVKRADGISKNLQWLASRRNPQVYGDSFNVNHTVTLDIRKAIDEAVDRAAHAIDVTPKELLESDLDQNNEVKSICSSDSKEETKE